ncbi:MULTISPECIES: zinc-dependent alcohol dehydrogenase [unclassified Blastococcus]
MRAAVFDRPGEPIRVERLPDPEPGPGDVLVRVGRAGICGTDLAMTSDSLLTYGPGPFGHEFAGEVVAVGAGVDRARIGELVACLPVTPCGGCPGCASGYALTCAAPRGGAAGFAELAAVPAAGAIALPRTLGPADGALVEPMACGLHALRRGRLRAGDRVLVLGAGSMALSAVHWARRIGAGRVVVASRSAHRREVAMAVGADAFHSTAEDDPAELDALLGGPVDVVAECVGKEGMVARAIELVGRGGTVVSMGMCMAAEAVVPALCAFKEATVVFPLSYTVDEFVETARAFDAGRLRAELMVSDVIALDELPGTMEQLRTGTRSALKVLVDPALG